jgi:hypothetical protein
MRTLVTATTVSIILLSCVSVDEDNLVSVRGYDQPPAGDYKNTTGSSAKPYHKFFSVTASFEALKGYGLSPAQAVAEITMDIVGTHGYCPHGYSVTHPPFTGSFRSGISWTIICND